jgi:hypothetical protein
MPLFRSAAVCAASLLLLFAPLRATTIPGTTFEEMTDRSEVIATGRVTRSWTAWDDSHKYIWTHYEIKLSGTYKGRPDSSLVVSEPGGVVGDRGMMIAGVSGYAVGEQVAVFLERMPNGYLRTTGWGQGKFDIDPKGRIHGTAGPNLEIAPASGTLRRGDTSIRSLDGIDLQTLRALISARVGAQTKAGVK